MGTRGRIVVGIFATLLALGFGSPVSHASGFQPQNDDLAGANDITNGGADFGPMLGASHETGEPHDTASDTGSVWEKWTAPAIGGTVTASMCDPNNLSGGPFDSLMNVYSGPATNPTYANITPVAFNDDGCGSSNNLSKVKWAALAGTTYYIRIDQDATAAGNYVMEIDVAPLNDDFAGTSIAGAPLTITGTNVGASKEANEPDIAGQPGGSSVWWSWTAPAAGSYVVRTCGSSFNTLLAVYTGSAFGGGGITLVQANDDSCGQQSQVTINVPSAGDVFRITVDGGPGISNVPETGNIQLAIGTTPTNDLLANATVVNGFPTSITGATLLATSEPAENGHGSIPAAHSIWYRWTAPSSGPVTIDTCGSTTDTTLSVYDDGNSFPLGTTVGDNNDSCGTQSRENFNASSAQTYAIAIDGVEGAVQLNIHDVTPPVATIDSAKIRSKKHRATFTFHGTDDRSGVVVECKLDGGAYTVCPSPVTYQHLHGSHTFFVRATDVAGNVTTTQRALKVKHA